MLSRSQDFPQLVHLQCLLHHLCIVLVGWSQTAGDQMSRFLLPATEATLLKQHRLSPVCQWPHCFFAAGLHPRLSSASLETLELLFGRHGNGRTSNVDGI